MELELPGSILGPVVIEISLLPSGPAPGKRRRLVKPRRFWTAEEDEILRRDYAHVYTSELAERLGRTVRAIYARTKAMGLHKDLDVTHQQLVELANRPDHGGRATRFKPGHKRSPNRGVKGWDAGGRSHETRFKAGERRGAANSNYQPVGTERWVEGYLYRKVTDEGGYFWNNWRLVHHLVWEDAGNAPVPDGHALVFRNGDQSDIRLENLELVSRAELMARNSIHNYPPELKDAIRLHRKLERTLGELETEDS